MGQSPHHSHPNTVWLAPCTTEQQQYDPIHNCCKKKNTSSKYSGDVKTPHGPSTGQNWEARILTGTEQEESKTKLAKTKTTNKTYTWWFHINKTSVRGSRNNETNLGYRFTLKEDKPSKASLWLQRTKIPLPTKVKLYTDTNAMKMGVRKSTLENLLELLQWSGSQGGSFQGLKCKIFKY